MLNLLLRVHAQCSPPRSRVSPRSLQNSWPAWIWLRWDVFVLNTDWLFLTLFPRPITWPSTAEKPLNYSSQLTLPPDPGDLAGPCLLAFPNKFRTLQLHRLTSATPRWSSQVRRSAPKCEMFLCDLRQQPSNTHAVFLLGWGWKANLWRKHPCTCNTLSCVNCLANHLELNVIKIYSRLIWSVVVLSMYGIAFFLNTSPLNLLLDSETRQSTHTHTH